MKLNKIAQCIALMGIAGYAFGQTAAEQKLERVEITGSSIKRIQDEGISAIQTIKAEDLLRLGISTAEQLLQSISANGNGIDGLMTNQGGDFLNSTAAKSHNNGSSGISLRGLGSQYTLVLLNGRRVATHGLNGESVDVNTIPLAAIDRVEILKDGASAIYGTDAIGGVVNFILKKDYKGVEVSAFTDRTQHGGGNISKANILWGAGNLDADGYNLMLVGAFSTNDRLRGSQRDFHNGYQPGMGLAMDTTGTPYANIGQASGTALGSTIRTIAGYPSVTNGYNRVNYLALTNQCNTIPDSYIYRGDITGFPRNNLACTWDYGKQWSMMQPVDNTNIVARGTYAINSKHHVTTEFVASRVKSSLEYTAVQLTTGDYNYPANGPYYQNLATLLPQYFKATNTDPTDTRTFFNASLPERIRWRCIPCGPRQQDTTTDAYRALVALDGSFGETDYKLGLSQSASKANTVYGDGVMVFDKLKAAIATGQVNPFLAPGQSQTAAATDLINGAKATGGSLYGGETNVSEIDGTLSREIGTLPGGPLALAVGFDLRREKYRFTNGQTGLPDVNGVTSNPSLPEASRDIQAMFFEVSAPLFKGVETQLAGRYDKYSDFGSTFNPKIGIRWQPVNSFMVRSAYSTGFHAPDFDSLYGSGTSGQFNSDINDPVTCPGGAGVGGNTDGCGIRPSIVTSSNPNLKPEKSKQWSLGFVVSPAPWFTASLDLWQIELTDRIGALSGQALIQNYAQYTTYIQRDSSGQISEVDAPFLNLAGDKARGADVNVTMNFKNDMGNWVLNLDGSRLFSYQSRFSDADQWVERVGAFGDTTFGYDLHPMWKHTASVSWTGQKWGATFAQRYTSGYDAEVDGYGSGVVPPNAPTKVDSYTLYDVSVNYTGIKNLRITGGIKNLFDKTPPFSAHNVDNVAGAGWDGRIGDPRMRSFTLNVNYKF